MHLKSQMRIQDAGEAFAFFDMEETCGNSNLVTARAAYFFRISSRIKIAQKGGENLGMHAALGGAPRAPSDAHTQTHRARSSSEGPNAPPTGPRRLTWERVLLHAPPPPTPRFTWRKAEREALHRNRASHRNRARHRNQALLCRVRHQHEPESLPWQRHRRRHR